MSVPKEDDAFLQVRTRYGPVGLRSKRKKVNMMIEGKKAEISKDWLRDQDTEMYLQAVKQAMLVAAEHVRFADARDPAFRDVPSAQVSAIQRKIQELLQWKPPPHVSESGKHSLKKVDKDDRKRELLVKFSTKFPVAAANRRQRSFIIEGESGELLYYRSTDPNAKLKDHYKLKDAECELESQSSIQIPKWEPGYDQRLRVDCKERMDQKKNPLYLYTKEPEKLRSWKRAFKLAKVLVNDLDRRALKVAIGRAISGSLVKAWTALVRYFVEIQTTRSLVKRMAFRMMKVDLSRGWNKLQLVRKKKDEIEKKKIEQQHWAARFMAEKLNKIADTKVKPPTDIREHVITTVQKRFREYREQMISERRYVLNPSKMAKIQEAKVGRCVSFMLEAVTCEEAICLSLDQQKAAFEQWVKEKEVLKTKRFTYSETILPLSTSNVFVSDNMTSLAFSTAEAQGTTGALSKADWSKFVNLDRISSIVLNSAPLVGGSVVAMSASDTGVWCTIHGPRLAWDRCLKDRKPGQPKRAIGAEDALEVPHALLRSDALNWVNLSVNLKGANVSWNHTVEWEQDQVDAPVSLVLHVLGYAFKSKPAVRRVKKEDNDIVFNFPCQASVPVGSDKEFVALDHDEIGLEIFEDKQDGKSRHALLLVGSHKLSQVFTAHHEPEDKKDKKGKPKAVPDFALASSMLEERGKKKEFTMKLFTPDGRHQVGHADLTVEPNLKQGKDNKIPFGAPDPVRLSPELVGGGVPTSLYTSHRSAWYDPELGPGKFRVDHVANFVQLTIGTLRFASADEAPALGEEPMYRIKAFMHGVSTTTQCLHRPSEKWALVLGSSAGDPQTIKFGGCDLFLPLLPGCWGSDVAERRRIVIQVIKNRSEGPEAVNLGDFLKKDGKPGVAPKEEMAYQAYLTFDHQMLVDRSKSLTVVLTQGGSGEPKDMDVSTTAIPSSGEQSSLNMEFVLRDRDYVKGAMGQVKNRRALCVGDKAMLVVEEPIRYPKDALEFRRRFCLGQFDPTTKEWPEKKRGAPLRAPCMSSEYSDSGLGEVVPRVPFLQAFIPKSCKDMIPHKFALPLTEKEFLDKCLPGSYERIVNDMISNAKAQRGKSTAARSNNAKPVVEYLSHTSRQIPVTVLAAYAGETYDLEVGSEFVEFWQKTAHRRFAMPGGVKLSPATADAHATRRVILMGVQMTMIRAINYSGINMYDASFISTADVLTVDPPQNDFNFQVAHADAGSGKQFRIAAGPLPPDASPASCQYEWSAHVRLPSEEDMYKFVATIRRCTRLDHFTQSSKMHEYQNRVQQEVQQPVAPVRQGPVTGGQLDVVLVEARRLMPKQSIAGKMANFDTSLVHNLLHGMQGGSEKPAPSIRPDVPIDDSYLPKLACTTAGEPSRSTPEGSKVTTYVNFKLKNILGGDARKQEIVAYKGQKVQMSCTMAGTDSPSWATAEDRPDLQRSGGWTFKTGHIDPDKMPDLIIQFEVMQAHVGFPSLIGFIQLPVTSRNFLTNSDECFKNLWLPLVTMKTVRDEEEGQEVRRPVANLTGEIHIMTRWLPAEKMQVLTDGSMKQQMSVRSHFLKEIWPRVCAPRVREPIYNMEALYVNSYDPNLVPETRPDGSVARPETQKDYLMRHVEELANTVEYLDCLDRRQVNAWEEFEAHVNQGDMGHLTLAKMREQWHHSQDVETLEQLQELIQQGIPASKREQLWSELTLASHVFDQDGDEPDATQPDAISARSESEYQSLLERGLGQRSDAMQQLAEDMFHLSSAWETSGGGHTAHMDLLLRRLKRAQNVITALLAVEDSGIVYCESLLIVAYFFLLPQGSKEEKTPEDAVLFSEHSVFWILYTLIQKNYREYYGVPNRPEKPPREPSYDESGEEIEEDLAPQPMLVCGSGAMQDVMVLECCVGHHMNDLWLHVTALGFQFATVFYGAFMRLYATYMPTASVFRFWDILLAQSADPTTQPHTRSYIIDLAFGVLRSKRQALLRCMSALEVRNMILGVFGSLYDTCTVVDITMVAHKQLWEGKGYLSGGMDKIGSLWTQRDELFKVVNVAVMEQNEVLKTLTHTLPLHEQTMSRNAPQRPPGATVKDIAQRVLPQLLNEMETLKEGSDERRQHWAMFRPMPLATQVLAEASLVHQAWKEVHKNLNVKKVVEDYQPYLVGPKKGSGSDEPSPGLEIGGVTATDLNGVLERTLKTWSTHAATLWNAFSCKQRRLPASYHDTLQPVQTDMQKRLVNVLGIRHDETRNLAEPHDEDKISMNEFFMSLMCACKGTVGEKASSLFNIYNYSDPLKKETNHIRPVSRLARSIASQGEADPELPRAPARDPNSPEARQNFCQLRVMSDHPRKHMMGVVYIPSLSPYIGTALEEPQFAAHHIWAEAPNTPRRAPHSASSSANQGAGGADSLVIIGEMFMAITWMPKNVRRPEMGSLSLNLKYIKFNPLYVADYYKMNPWVEVSMLGTEREAGAAEDERVWKPMPRWDPRGLWATGEHHSYLTTGPYGGHMEFGKTMKVNLVSGLLGHHDSFSQHWRSGQQMGYDEESQQWQWNDIWGNQRSDELDVMPEFVTVSKRKNCISLECCRLVTQVILQRCMLNLTNREALLIADSVFNRAGVVPGFLEAIIVQGEPSKEDDAPENLDELKEMLEKKKETYKVVTREVMLEHEREIKDAGGILNLFSRELFFKRNMLPINISNQMQIRDPFPGKRKELWIRFIRGGDGERCTRVVEVEPNGDIVPNHGDERANPEIEISKSGWVSKEEFVSCIMGSPLLGESLRRLGACDHVPHERKAIPLNVTIMDPHHEEENREIEDALDYQQSFLLEVWDSDTLMSKDFLGEVWLPPLNTLGTQPKSMVLPLTRANYSQDAEFGPSRQDKSKEIGDEEKNPHFKVTGELYVTASWKYPILRGDEEVPEDDPKKKKTDEDRARERAERAMKQNSGLLTLKIERARGLRRADAKRGRDSDPQVRVWQRNDVVQQWRKRPILKTKVVHNTVNPEFMFEGQKDIMTGEYESRFPPPEEGWKAEVTKALRSRKQQRRLDDERNVTAVQRYGANGLKVSFYDAKGPPPKGAEPGGNHKVQVLLTDSIQEFKEKLTLACKREAQHWRTQSGQDSKAAEFSDIEIGHNHLVMVWVPSAAVQRLAAQKITGEEYTRAYRQSERDPSCWKPLDPARTFAHYPKHFSQNLRGEVQSQILRVAEATEAYRAANLRYKVFMEEITRTSYQDVNTSEKCFGWAKYKHEEDGPNSTEWRPAFISNADQPGDGSPRFKVRWVLDDQQTEDDVAAAAAAPPGSGTLHRQSEVLLAPRIPKLGARGHPAHKEFLAQAKLLRDSRKSDFEIKDVLNKLLLDKWNADDKFKEAYGEKEPGTPGGIPLITVDIIKGHLQRIEEASQAPTTKL